MHPWAVKLFEGQWLVNLILWGQYDQLRDAALAEFGDAIGGTTLQVGCAYGDLTNRLCSAVTDGGGEIDIVDVLPIQLGNLKSRLPAIAPVRLLAMDSSSLRLPDASYNRALVFFLLQEQPDRYRELTLSEVFRVLKPGGKIVIVEYAAPKWWHPLRYLWGPVLAHLEPFALDLWHEEINHWFPPGCMLPTSKKSFFAGLYQKVVIAR